MIAEKETFKSQFDRWLQEQSPVERVRSPGYFLIGTTSKALKSIGMEDNRIFFGKSKVQKIMDKHPEMTPKVIKRVPEVLEYPVMVLQSQTVMNRITLFGEVLDSDGKPVLVALELSPQNKRGEILNFAVIASAYGKNNVQQLISHSDMLYIDPNKKRTDSWLRLLGLQLPSRVTNYGSINRITFVSRDVNGIFQSKTDSSNEKTAVEIALERAQEKAENNAIKKEGNMKYYDIDEAAARIESIHAQEPELITETAAPPAEQPAAMNPAEPPIVTIIASENKTIKQGMQMSLAEADSLFAAVDAEKRMSRTQEGYKGSYCDKVQFRIDFTFGGITDYYEGRQDLGDGDGSLVDHIETYHKDFFENEEWKNYIVKYQGAEAWEKERGIKERLLTELVPYLRLHCKDSQIEQDKTLAKSEQPASKGRTEKMTRTRYTQEEYRLAREVNILDYLRDNGYELQKAGKDFMLKEHNSLKINRDGKWYWYARDTGGNSPIELLKQLYGDSSPIAAIKELADYARGGSAAAEPSMVNTGRSEKDPPKEEKREFQLPERNINDKRAFAYLKETRGIDPEIISACMATGLLYESKQYHNVVFVGQQDEQGQVCHASLRGTYTNAAKPFKGDVSGSDKTYSFALQGAPESRRLYVCESAIDVLSHASIASLDGEDWRRDHRLALGGMSQASLDHYLQDHPEIKELVLCLDNDLDGKDPNGQPENHGQIRAAALAAEYMDRGYTVQNYVPTQKDLNEELQSRRKQSKGMAADEKKMEGKADSAPMPTAQSTSDRESKGTTEPSDFDNIAKRLEEGIKEVFTSANYLQCLKVMSRFHAYSINNLLLIQQQRPEAVKVAGYQAWQKKFGRHVKRQEKGIQILAPIIKSQRVQMEGRDAVTGEKTQVIKEIKKVTGYKLATVFDISQTEGKELPQLTPELQKSVDGYTEMVAAVQAISEIPFEFEKLAPGVKGIYFREQQRISINKGMSELQTIKTAVHELAHARLHKDAPELSKSQKETEAESIAFVVCSHFGLDTSEYSFPYLASWSSGKELSELKKSLETIKKEAGKIIEELTREIENQRDNQLAESEQPAEELVPVKPEEMKIAAEKNVWLSGPEQDGQPTMMRAADLDQNKSFLPHTYDQYLLKLFCEGFQKNPLQTLSLFGAAYKDNGLNQIILLKDPTVQNALENAKSVSSCMRIIQGQLITGNEIPGKVKVQINWSESGLSSGQFFTLAAANKIFGEFESQARSAGRLDQTQFALYVETQKGVWKYGESRMEFGSGSASDLMDFIQKTMPPEIVEKCEKVFKQQEKNLNEQAGPAKKVNEEKERERVN